MKLSLSLGLIFFSLLSLFFMLYIKSDVQRLSTERHALISEQKQLRENLKVLQAEYALLSSSERLYEFAEKRGMKELLPKQILPLPSSFLLAEGE